MRGLFCVYKPRGLTSTDVVARIKRVIGKKHKVGHGGTLDPDAEGVLVIGVGSSCKDLHQHFLHDTKGQLGITTHSLDFGSPVCEVKDFQHVDKELLDSTLRRFIGTISQVPPLFSAVKFKGKRSYNLARSGEKVEIEEKRRLCEVHDLKLLDFNLPYFDIEVKCSRGFYIRSLVRDIGMSVDSVAYVTKLQRTTQGPFSILDCLRLEQCTRHKILSLLDKE